MVSTAPINTTSRICSLTEWSIRRISDIFESDTDDESLASIEATFTENVTATINGVPLTRDSLAQRVIALRRSSQSGLHVVWHRTADVVLDPHTNRVGPRPPALAEVV